MPFSFSLDQNDLFLVICDLWLDKMIHDYPGSGLQSHAAGSELVRRLPK